MPVLDRATFRQLVLLPPACLLLTSCMPDGGAVGAVATGHFSARHHFPVIMISWCGDSPPEQIDLTSEDHEWRLTANRDFPGHEVEVNLASPGEDWEISDGEGAAAYRIVPDSPDTEYTLGVTSADGVERESEHDIAALEFDTEMLSDEDGLYLSEDTNGDGTMTAADDFPPEC
ncbi:hypothetical protein [Nocardiopsis oceani]